MIGYPSGQDGAILPAWDYPPCPQEKFPRKPYNKSFIDQACSVKMAGYWPRSFFASLWTSTPSRSINSQRKNLTNIQPYILTEQAWSITHIYFNLTHAVSQTFFFAIGRLKLFSVPFLSFFSALLLSSLLAFHILSGCRKKLGVNYGQSLEMGP